MLDDLIELCLLERKIAANVLSELKNSANFVVSRTDQKDISSRKKEENDPSKVGRRPYFS